MPNQHGVLETKRRESETNYDVKKKFYLKQALILEASQFSALADHFWS